MDALIGWFAAHVLEIGILTTLWILAGIVARIGDSIKQSEHYLSLLVDDE